MALEPGPLTYPPVDDNFYPGGEGDTAPRITQTLSNAPLLWMPEVFPETCVRQGWGVEVVEAGISPSSLSWAGITNGPLVDLDFSFQWEMLFPGLCFTARRSPSLFRTSFPLESPTSTAFPTLTQTAFFPFPTS